MKPTLITYTNGFEGTWPAIEYSAWMAHLMDADLILSGVVEVQDDDHPLEEMFSRAVTLFQENQVAYSLELENGLVEDCISRRFSSALEDSDSLSNQFLVVGKFGRTQVRRMLVGNTFRKIMESVSIPILFVPAVRIPIKRILICMGGIGNPFSSEHLGLKAAQINKAAITFLTIVPPVDLDYPEAREVRDHWKNLAETDTLPGRTLRDGLKRAQAGGVEARIKIRHGNIVEQILLEIKETNYDLICMGSQYSFHGLRQVYSPNITADVAELAHIPILTQRFPKPQGK